MNDSWTNWRELLERVGPLDRDHIPAVLRKTINGVRLGSLPWPLVILGEAGSGKTCAALLMLDAWRTGFFSTCSDWSWRMAEAKFRRLTSSLGYLISDAELWRDWERAKLAVLDDLGTREKPTDHQYETLLRSIDLRQNQPTVYISNQSLADLSRCYDDRIASRLKAGTVVTVTGDQRKAKGRRIKAPQVLGT